MSLARNGFIVDPTYLGQTAEEHVEFIKKNSIEEQYIYISRLTQKAITELQDLRKQVEKSITSLCKKLDLDRKDLQESIFDSYARHRASIRIKDLFLGIKLEILEVIYGIDNLDLIQKIDNLYLQLESYNSSLDSDTDVKKYTSLFPKEKFTTEIQSIKELIKELQKHFHDSESTLRTLNDILNTIVRYPEKVNYEITLMVEALLGILSERYDRYEFSEFEFFQSFIKEEAILDIFLTELEIKTTFLKEQALMMNDDMLDSMKINWIGVQEDCAKLINFLVDHKFIEKKQGGINQFIVKHFKFKGENKNNEEYGSKNSSCGSIIVMGNDLKISK